MLDLSLQQVLIRIAVTLFLTSTYGFYLAAAAYILGDKGPYYDKRLTLNPFAHTGVIGTLSLLVLGLGWIKPVYIEAEHFRRPRLDCAVVVLSTLGASLLVALFLIWLRPYLVVFGSTSMLQFAIPFVNNLFVTTALSCMLNLIPIPPLIGGQALYTLSPQLYSLAQRHARWAAIALGLLLFSGVAGGLLTAVRLRLLDLLR